MVMQWQRDLPEAQGSMLHPIPQRIELFRSASFAPKGCATPAAYEVLIEAEWGDACNNGSNSFFCRPKVVIFGGRRESERVGMDEVPADILATLPADILALQKWNGCHPFGPWYYIENTLCHAGDKDCWGLRKGERRQIVNGKTGEPCWQLVAVLSPEEIVPLYKLSTTTQGERPLSAPVLEWRAWEREGEGKARELDHARSCAIWPDATDAQLTDPNLATALKMRLPALLIEFRTTLERLGFTW